MVVGLWIYESERRNRGKEREIIGGKVKEEGMKTGVFGCVRAKGGRQKDCEESRRRRRRRIGSWFVDV